LWGTTTTRTTKAISTRNTTTTVKKVVVEESPSLVVAASGKGLNWKPWSGFKIDWRIADGSCGVVLIIENHTKHGFYSRLCVIK